MDDGLGFGGKEGGGVELGEAAKMNGIVHSRRVECVRKMDLDEAGASRLIDVLPLPATVSTPWASRLSAAREMLRVCRKTNIIRFESAESS